MSEEQILNLALLYWREAAAVFVACVAICGVLNWMGDPVGMPYLSEYEYAWPNLTSRSKWVYSRNESDFNAEYIWPNLSQTINE